MTARLLDAVVRAFAAAVAAGDLNGAARLAAVAFALRQEAQARAA
jgi:hypothetical protein